MVLECSMGTRCRSARTLPSTYHFQFLPFSCYDCFVCCSKFGCFDKFEESTCGSTFAASSTASINDAQGNEWTITSGLVTQNGYPDSATTGVARLSYVNNVVWQLVTLIPPLLFTTPTYTPLPEHQCMVVLERRSVGQR